MDGWTLNFPQQQNHYAFNFYMLLSTELFNFVMNFQKDTLCFISNNSPGQLTINAYFQRLNAVKHSHLVCSCFSLLCEYYQAFSFFCVLSLRVSQSQNHNESFLCLGNTMQRLSWSPSVVSNHWSQNCVVGYLVLGPPLLPGCIGFTCQSV